jgi:hypothetical protein
LGDTIARSGNVGIRAGVSGRGGTVVLSGLHERWDLHSVQVIGLGSLRFVGYVAVTGALLVTYATLALAPLFVLFGTWDRYRRRAEADRAVAAR